jgi:hypothetical protein
LLFARPTAATDAPALFAAEAARWRKVIVAVGIKAE